MLSDDEIRMLWHGLDRHDMPWIARYGSRSSSRWSTMLRSGELLRIHRDELNTDGEQPAAVDIPARRVKKRREIHQPLSDLAMEIVKEAMGNTLAVRGPLRR